MKGRGNLRQFSGLKKRDAQPLRSTCQEDLPVRFEDLVNKVFKEGQDFWWFP